MEKACKMTFRRQAEYTQPQRGEGVTEITSDAIGGRGRVNSVSVPDRDHSRYKLEETGPTCGNQAPGSACKCSRDVRNSQSRGFRVNLKTGGEVKMED